jgi:hypothetical protein
LTGCTKCGAESSEHCGYPSHECVVNTAITDIRPVVTADNFVTQYSQERTPFRRRESEPVAAVRDFMNKFGFLDAPYTKERIAARHELLNEEMREYNDAVAAGDIVEQIDALCDIVYVAIGTVIAHGLDFDAHYAAVQKANMAKERGTKSTRPNSGGFDVIKPPGWVGPEDEHRRLIDDVWSLWTVYPNSSMAQPEVKPS